MLVPQPRASLPWNLPKIQHLILRNSAQLFATELICFIMATWSHSDPAHSTTSPSLLTKSPVRFITDKPSAINLDLLSCVFFWRPQPNSETGHHHCNLPFWFLIHRINFRSNDSSVLLRFSSRRNPKMALKPDYFLLLYFRSHFWAIRSRPAPNRPDSQSCQEAASQIWRWSTGPFNANCAIYCLGRPYLEGFSWLGKNTNTTAAGTVFTPLQILRSHCRLI